MALDCFCFNSLFAKLTAAVLSICDGLAPEHIVKSALHFSLKRLLFRFQKLMRFHFPYLKPLHVLRWKKEHE